MGNQFTQKGEKRRPQTWVEFKEEFKAMTTERDQLKAQVAVLNALIAEIVSDEFVGSISDVKAILARAEIRFETAGSPSLGHQ